MDYKQNISLLIKSLFMVLLLSSCGHELSTGNKVEPESLAIIGSVPDTIYYDSEIEFELGAKGGDGVYRYRYIQNPENPDEDDTDFVFNPVELTIENLDDAKPLFKVKGIHRTEQGVEMEDIPRGTYSYQIELTDGKNVKLQTYEFKLEISGVKVTSSDLSPAEGVVTDAAAKNLLLVRQSGNTRICSSIEDSLFEKKTLPNGMTVYPYVFEITFDVPILERVEFFYRFNSHYNEQLPENHKTNLGLARPGVDYVDEERSVVFEADQGACVIYLDVLDDSIIEGVEKLNVEFYERKGGFIQNELGQTSIQIQDNEPLPVYETKEVIGNEGDKVVASFSLARPYTHPLSINVSIDDVNTTASPDDYLLTPENGVVVIAAGDLEASYTVSLLENQDDANLLADDIISITTDIDDQLSNDPYKITINEWPLVDDHEIVASSANKEKALAIEVNSLGVVSVLIEGLSSFDEEQAIAIARKRDGTDLKLSDSATGALILAKQGLRVRPVAIGSYILNETSLIIIVANVDGLLSNVHRGLGDFVVAVYSRDNTGFYKQQSIKQYGSEGDDIAIGATFDGKGSVYVFGESNGLEFDGVSSFEVNNGKKDGFVYKIDFIENETIWNSPRFIGTADDDSVLALDIGRNDLVLLAETINTDKDGFLQKLSTADNGRDVEGIAEMVLSSTSDDHGKAIRFDQDDSTFFALVDSSSSLPDGAPTPTLTRDINLLSYDAEGGYRTTTSVSTSANDVSVDIEILTKEDSLVIGGYTEGEFENNTKKGSSGRDAFVSVLPTGNSDASSVNVLLQFGTEGNDQVIDIEDVSENKFLVLWSEDHTNGGGITRYRVSAFSSEGVMLSKEL